MSTLPIADSNRLDHWLRLWADRATQIYWVMALDPPQMLYISPAFEQIWKMPASAVMGDPELWINTIVAEDQKRVNQLYGSILDGHSLSFDISYRIIDGHGAIRWIRDTGSVLKEGNGGGRIVLGIAEDATELHRSEHSLRQRAEWFGLITEQAPVVLWTTDRKLRITSSAGLGLRDLGVKPNELNGMSLFEYFGTDDPDFLPIKMHLRALRDENIEYEIEWSNRHYQSRLRPFHDSTGEVIGIIGAAFDVTDLKRAERTLRESEETYRTLIEHNPDLTALLVEGKLAYVNDALTRVTGFSREEMIGRSPVEFVIPEDRARAAERIMAVLSGDTPRPSEYRIIRRDGALRTIEVLAQRISYHGQPALVAFIRDITERREAEEEIRKHGEALERLVEESNAQVRELERQRAESDKLAVTGRMAARVAHEINNPLASIKSAFKLIRDAVPATHPHFDYVGRIDREIERIAHIVRLMYRLYRPDSLEWQMVHADQVIRDVVFMLAFAGREKNVILEMGELQCPPIYLPVGYLEQVLYNLILNAIEATPPGSLVRIEAGPGPTGIAISVADQGPGIAPELRPRVFEPFFSTKGEGDPAGLGLGLSTTRSIAEAVGGSVEFSDRPGGGTVFTVILPGEKPQGDKP